MKHGLAAHFILLVSSSLSSSSSSSDVVKVVLLCVCLIKVTECILKCNNGERERK